jgi:predicted dienelactone hydrolase
VRRVRANFLAGWLALSFLPAIPAAAVGGEPPTRCLEESGAAAVRCLRSYVPLVARCRDLGDPACEEELRSEDGALDRALSGAAEKGGQACTDAQAETLGYIDAEDVAQRVSDACMDFGEDFLDLALSADLANLSARQLYCQRVVASSAKHLLRSVTRAYASRCFVARYEGSSCDRSGRDRIVGRARLRAGREIAYRCGAAFDALGLVEGGGTLGERIDSFLATVVERGRHLAQLVYPPNDLGPTASFGPYPVGVRTLELLDPDRQAANGMGARPVRTEVYYPSTADAVAGEPRDVIQVLGIDLVATPAYRNVARAAGRFPLVLFSHGNGGIRFQSFFFVAHLASHGFIVATPDHHGNTFTDALVGIVDGSSLVNRPLDMKFLIDELAAFDAEPGGFLEGAVDLDRIGVSGHSFGGLTTFALAGGATVFGTFTEPRIKAIFPQAPSAAGFADEYFSTITVPTLIVGGSIDETTPFEGDQQLPFDNLPSGASIVGVAELIGGGHFTFSDFCEVPRELLAFLGGFEEACEPRHLPWRHAHDIVNYLALNFFDATLNGNAEAAERLAPENLAAIEDLVYQAK